MTVEFFSKPSDFRKWLQKNHKKIDVLWVGYYKVATGIPSINWEESVKEALCYGWIDGLRKTIDEDSYKIRFTPRRPKSNWSDLNLKHFKELKKQGKIKPAGQQAFDEGKKERAKTKTKNGQAENLKKEYEKKIKASKKAWAYFNGLSPSVKKKMVYWIMSAKKEETQLRRVDSLIQEAEK